MLLFSPIEIVIKMLSKKNDVLPCGFLTTLHLEVSGRPSASPSGTTLHLLAKHRWKREKNIYWSNSYENWGNEWFKSIQIVRNTSRKIREILQTFFTIYPPDAYSNLPASPFTLSQIPVIKILPCIALREAKSVSGVKALSQTLTWFSILFHYLKIPQNCFANVPLPLSWIVLVQAKTILLCGGEEEKIMRLCMPLALRVRGQALMLSGFLL